MARSNNERQVIIGDHRSGASGTLLSVALECGRHCRSSGWRSSTMTKLFSLNRSCETSWSNRNQRVCPEWPARHSMWNRPMYRRSHVASHCLGISRANGEILGRQRASKVKTFSCYTVQLLDWKFWVERAAQITPLVPPRSRVS